MKKKPLSIGYCYFLVFCLIIFSQEVLMFGTNRDPAYAVFKHAVVVLVFFVAFGYALLKKVHLPVRAVCVVLILVLFTLLTAVVTEQSFTLKYGYACLNYILALLVIVTVSADNFKKAFFDIVFFLTVFSLITYALGYLYPAIIYKLPLIINDAGYKYGNMLFSVIPYDIHYTTFRNYGIFREPSAHQIFLNLAIMFGLDAGKEVKIWKIGLLIMAVITTFSTAGYLICVVVVGTYIFGLAPSRSIRTVVGLVLTAAIGLYLIRNSYIEYDSSIFSKLFTDNASVNSRFGSILVDLYLGFKRPLFGNGYAFLEENFKKIALESFALKEISNTNTLMKMFAVHGIVPVCVCIWGQIKFFRNYLTPQLFLFNAIAFFMMLSSVEIMFNIVIYIIMMYGVAGASRRSTIDANFTNQRGTIRKHR